MLNLIHLGMAGVVGIWFRLKLIFFGTIMLIEEKIMQFEIPLENIRQAEILQAGSGFTACWEKHSAQKHLEKCSFEFHSMLNIDYYKHPSHIKTKLKATCENLTPRIIPSFRTFSFDKINNSLHCFFHPIR